MNKNELLKTCELLYATYNIPLVVFDENLQTIGYECPFGVFCKAFERLANAARESGRNPALVSDGAGIYGAVTVNGSGGTVIVGPFKNKKITDEVLANVVREHELNWDDLNGLKEFLTAVPSVSYNKFLNFVGLLHYLINREGTDVLEYFDENAERFKIPEKHAEGLWQGDDFVHGTYNLEQRLLSYVQNGDVEGLSAYFNNVIKTPITEGKLADDALRQSKNIFIGFIALVGKVGAIKGNLDIEQAYRLIDLYTQECERCVSVNQVNELRYNAIMDFTRRVAELKHPEAYSNEVYSALQFIKTHTNQPIGVDDVLKHVYKSRSSFMEQFKKETGETIGRYIMKAKLQESKLLLVYSDKTLAEISNFFYFSSQSHFQNLFKKEYGITPLAYRKKKQK